MLLFGAVCADDFLPDVLFLTAFKPTTQHPKLQNLLLFVSHFTEISFMSSILGPGHPHTNTKVLL